MGIMILPLVSSLSEDALHSVPNGLREGAYALGVDTHADGAARRRAGGVLRHLGGRRSWPISRAIGETMIVAIAAGQQPRLTLDPRVPVETMTAYIVQVSLGDTPAGTLEYRTIFAVGMLLFLSTFVLNLVSNWLREPVPRGIRMSACALTATARGAAAPLRHVGDRLLGAFGLLAMLLALAALGALLYDVAARRPRPAVVGVPHELSRRAAPSEAGISPGARRQHLRDRR